MRPWHAIGLFCEDVRQEKNGQSLMAIWPDNVQVPQIPGALPRMAVFVRVQVEPTADIGAISAKILFPDKSEHPIGDFSAEQVKETQKTSREAGAPWAGFMLTAIAFGFPIEQTGRLLLVAKIGDEEIVCGGLNVVLGEKVTPSSTASLPPP